MYKEIDRENMFKAIWDFPENLMEAENISKDIKLKQKYSNIQNIVIVGMGGSAIGGDIMSILEKHNLNIPLFVCRNYLLPNWVNKNSLIICSSYSGNTEETLSALDDALRKNAQIIGVTTGGELANRLKILEKDIVVIPSGLQPRAALGFSFIPMIIFLVKIEIIQSVIEEWLYNSIKILKKKRELYSLESENNPIYKLAKNVHNKIPIIYSNISTMGIAGIRLKGQFCENGKMLSYNNELPELNHNEIVGWGNNYKILKNLVIIWLKDIDDNQRIKHRQKITQNILDDFLVKQYIIQVEGKTFQERFLHMINYGDWLSFWCAILHETDPSPVEKINILKKELSTII